MLILKIFYGIIMIVIWVLLIQHRRNVKSWTGNFTWAETYLWRWGTYLVLIFFGLFLIFFGSIYPFWWLALLFW